MNNINIESTEMNTCRLITCTGYGATGSSAGTNILQEFEFVKDLGNEEYTFLHEPDGVADLENSLMEGHRLKTDLAIKRFIGLSHKLMLLQQYKIRFNGNFEKHTADFIDAIVKCKWDGWWHRAFEVEELSKIDDFNIRLARGTYDFLAKSNQYNFYEPDLWHPQYKPQITEYYSNFLNDSDSCFFIEQVKNFTGKLLQEENTNNRYKYILMDQAIPPISISRYLRYWDNPKVIVIDRDPRDLYVMNKLFWGCGFIPVHNIDQFIKWYSLTRKLKETEPKGNESNCLFLQFESLIYDYENTLNRIINFVNLSADNHIYKLKYFNPELSKQNTLVFKQYPDLYNDIEKIENELEQYCYLYPAPSYCNHHINLKFSVQKVYDEISDIQHNGKIPKGLRKYSINIFFRMTGLYQYFKERKKRKGLRLLKFIIKTGFLVITLPFEFIWILLVSVLSKNKLYRYICLKKRDATWF
jgi:hypothetical protein